MPKCGSAPSGQGRWRPVGSRRPEDLGRWWAAAAPDRQAGERADLVPDRARHELLLRRHAPTPQLLHQLHAVVDRAPAELLARARDRLAALVLVVAELVRDELLRTSSRSATNAATATSAMAPRWRSSDDIGDRAGGMPGAPPW
jgi:hypothetical protein